MEGSEFLEYLELQDSLDMVSKSDLIETVRSRGARITERQLTTYITEGLIPKSARIGSRAGAYPKIVVELVVWIDSCRQRGLGMEAIKELIPVWKFVKRAVKNHELNFQEFEYVARQFVRSTEAAYAVPTLLQSCMPCPIHEVDEFRAIHLVLKNGREIDPNVDTFIPLAFTIAEQDDDGEVRVVASTRFAVPLTFDHDETSIILGVPNGVDVPVDHEVEVELGVGAPSNGSSGETQGGVDATEGG